MHNRTGGIREPITHKLRHLLSRLNSKKGIEWIVEADYILVSLSTHGRRQRIHVVREDNQYVFSTVVLASHCANRTRTHRRRLALRAWTRNAETELVNFTFDGVGRLVAEIRHPVGYLDLVELEIYLKLLATEGDRFEYVLTGGDEH